MKDKLMIGVVFLLVFLAGFASQIQDAISTTGKATASRCTIDTDGGMNYGTAGTITIRYNTWYGKVTTKKYTDVCIDGQRLREYYCGGNLKAPYVDYTCPNGCLNGACKPSTCINECSQSGIKNCFTTTQYKTCGNYDTDSCLEWSIATVCPSDCENGVCIKMQPPENVCKLMKRGTGKINFLVIPNRGISQEVLSNGTFTTYINELLFGKANAYYYSQDFSTANKPALGLFDITPLNEYKDSVNIYYLNQTTSLDCDLFNVPDVFPQNCSSLIETLAKQCFLTIHYIIILDKDNGWDVSFGNSAFINHHLNYYYVSGVSSPLPFFESGRVAAHEFGHSIGLTHSLGSLLQQPILIGESGDAYQESLKQRNIPPNCDIFTCTKWCKGVNLNSSCLNKFNEFLNQLRIECGSEQNLDCQKQVWSAFVASKGTEPIDTKCNIGVDCLEGTGCYTSACGGLNAYSLGGVFLAGAGDSVMGSDRYAFNAYEANLIRNYFNSIK